MGFGGALSLDITKFVSGFGAGLWRAACVLVNVYTISKPGERQFGVSPSTTWRSLLNPAAVVGLFLAELWWVADPPLLVCLPGHASA